MSYAVCDRFGPDRLSRLLLWEIARLRRVVLVLYRQISACPIIPRMKWGRVWMKKRKPPLTPNP